MKYISTRNKSLELTSAEAIVKGISDEGGLFVPSVIPKLSDAELNSMKNMPYKDRAYLVLSKFLTDFTPEELKHCTDNAYASQWDTENIYELNKLNDNTLMLELWHGPTSAFKDMALQILPYLLTTAAKKTGLNKEILILTATSGDTGKAALEGFKDVPHTRIIVFYPDKGVSDVQKLQMTSTGGKNTLVCGVRGNFDDCQTAVKQVFTDNAVKEILSDKGIVFSSANSINWGRLAPQIAYYVSAYVDLLARGEVSKGEKINVCVPTGNFGNILAAYYAKEMVMPINKLICASNKNRILTDYITTGLYDTNREFYTTISPSMDILISSNLERMNYILFGENSAGNKTEKLSELFIAGSADDEKTKKTIKQVWDDYSYLVDTHTAVALSVLGDVRKSLSENENLKTIVASTANPYKFENAVSAALGFDTKETGVPIPAPLKNLPESRFFDIIDSDGIRDYVLNYI
ncbi:MAG: threonine synthase [Ruminococcus sp.]|jgi:threonine synthase|nr:threonine synthase [Ruminococcus sp.]